MKLRNIIGRLDLSVLDFAVPLVKEDVLFVKYRAF